MSPSTRKLEALFGDKLQKNVQICNYTTSRTGGTVLGLIPVNTLDEMRKTAQALWEIEMPFRMLGSGSNMLISDKGWEGVMVLNRCHNIKIHSAEEQPTVYAESGANLGAMARQCSLRGIGGLEWANSIPGSVGGAVYGNAGAHGSDIADTLHSALILFKEQGEYALMADDMAYAYRSSFLKREQIRAVILAATFNALHSSREASTAKMNAFTAQRLNSQPQGASTGSTFKNPEGDYAGRLIEAAGLKGKSVGHAQISPLHANFIVNDGKAKAQDYYHLIRLMQEKVKAQSGIDLELEIELLGEFEND
ncbi:MAG: UDP-N-acetylmuramate dehydrogenase [Anaerolineaceae bacterium]|nr:UDP-N-acetylmuramate dehydrogenase [Anaerolineaceae bacterium]